MLTGLSIFTINCCNIFLVRLILKLSYRPGIGVHLQAKNENNNKHKTAITTGDPSKVTTVL